MSEFIFKWVREINELDQLTSLFIDNSTNNYISHTEIQEGRATDENTWAENIRDILAGEFAEAVNSELFNQSNIGAAYIDQKIIGFMLLEFKNSPKGPFAILSDIVVDHEYRNKDIGIKLINWLLPQLKEKNIKELFAESNINNTPAHSFLEKSGFKTISKVFKMKID